MEILSGAAGIASDTVEEILSGAEGIAGYTSTEIIAVQQNSWTPGICLSSLQL